VGRLPRHHRRTGCRRLLHPGLEELDAPPEVRGSIRRRNDPVG
jgi:hypothetical protein